MELYDGDLLLRPLELGDLKAVVEACGDPEIPRFTLLVPSPYTEEDGLEFLTHVEQQWREGTAERTFAITAGGEFLGVVGIGLDTGVLGYWLKREARGLGWTTRAVIAVVDWARREGVTEFSLTTHPDNIASQRVALKAGFHEIGSVDEPRGFRDGTTTAILFELAGQAQ
jgi:RimJ/RimL family protein N-acetyltransferase